MRTILSFLVLFTCWVIQAPSATAEVTWESKGWVKLGERKVDGRLDRDVITLDADAGRFKKLTLVVDNSDLELVDFEVTFVGGQKHHPNVRHFFKEGSRTRVIDLPGDDRAIKSIALRYRNVADRAKAHVEIWGWPGKEARAGGDRGDATFDPRGWTRLGEATLDGRADRDRIVVDRDSGKYTRMTIVIAEGDVDLMDFEVEFRSGAPWNPNIKHMFKEGQRTRTLEFPGGARAIKHIDIKYANVDRGRARVEVWAR